MEIIIIIDFYQLGTEEITQKAGVWRLSVLNYYKNVWYRIHDDT